MGYTEDRLKRKLGLAAPLPTRKEKKPISKVSPKRAKLLAEEKVARGDGDSELQRWFKARIKQLTGHCAECGAKVETKNYQYAILSVCHILAKRETVCPSVRVHPLNFIELCPYHHDQLDKANWKEIEGWGCWETIRDRLVMIYPDLDPSERRFFPESVLAYMEKNKPF